MIVGEKMKKLIKDIIYKDLEKNVIRVDEISDKGIVNRVFTVITSDNTKFIIRMRDNSSALAEYEKERWCIERATSLGIISPKVFAVGLYDKVAYMIESYVEGINGIDAKEIQSELWKKIGEYARKINSIEAIGFGLDFKNGVFYNDFTPNWKAYVQYNISCLKKDDECINFGVYDICNQNIIKNVFRELLNKGFDFGLCHGDLSPRNAIINLKDVCLIDWGCAMINIYPHYDIITLLRGQIMKDIPNDNQIQSFFDGYGILEEEYQIMKRDVYAILLIDAYDKLRWAFDKSHNDINEYSEYARIATIKTLETFKEM
jgi:fructosamine-3-kinase